MFLFATYLNMIWVYFAQKRILTHLVFRFLKPKNFNKFLEELRAKGTRLDTKFSQNRAWLETEAYKIVENSLDVVTIVKELNNLNVLTNLLLQDYHRKLAPMAALSLQAKFDKD